MVMSLGYANALLAGQSQATLRELEMTQNHAVRVVTRTGQTRACDVGS